MNPETKIEAYLHKRVRLLGGICWKLVPIEAGIPDRLVMLPHGRMYLVEVKTSTGAISAVQSAMHARLRSIGIEVYVLFGMEEVVEWLRRMTIEHTGEAEDTTHDEYFRR